MPELKSSNMLIISLAVDRIVQSIQYVPFAYSVSDLGRLLQCFETLRYASAPGIFLRKKATIVI